MVSTQHDGRRHLLLGLRKNLMKMRAAEQPMNGTWVERGDTMIGHDLQDDLGIDRGAGMTLLIFEGAYQGSRGGERGASQRKRDFRRTGDAALFACLGTQRPSTEPFPKR